MDTKKEKSEEKVYERIKNDGKTTNRVEEEIAVANYSLSYSTDIIEVNKNRYVLNFPLRCLFEKEADYYLINNEQLDIIGTGQTQEEAEQNFNEEFDYLYNRLNALDDSQLNKRLLRIKQVLNSFVKQVF